VLEREFNRNFFFIKVLLSTDRFEKCGLEEKLIEDELYLIYADPYSEHEPCITEVLHLKGCDAICFLKIGINHVKWVFISFCNISLSHF